MERSLESLAFPPPSPTRRWHHTCPDVWGATVAHSPHARLGSKVATSANQRHEASMPAASQECRDCLRRTSATIVWVCALGERQIARLANSSRSPPRSIARLNLRREQTNTPWNDAASQHFRSHPGVIARLL
ncbi:MAG: hypothetical protein IH919_09105 [Deltaproteobacteria bacterium]|nr:hypothetical protein [Deltaproteobacteria bacterium]